MVAHGNGEEQRSNVPSVDSVNLEGMSISTRDKIALFTAFVGGPLFMFKEFLSTKAEEGFPFRKYCL